ncbi:Arc family DNA-binding protein [Serratia ficaria]|uniref:Arc family DNA-binding protein n=1 Tax=Serratia ficaria TaxID=61651 RepID=UPI0021796487|nr:Arc family DNA-binding protein [Serratia ficaria]CAI1141745.1 Arc-like DNA binding domain [Serratia ficaria]CAI2016665.1 Arc-like DNA binding domain [Serratia ficaria]
MKGMRNIAPFGLRMPDELREAIAERAKKNGRSMNAEIIQILQEAITHEVFDTISSKENLEKMPADIKLDLIRKRYEIAKIKMAQAYTALEENVELLKISDEELMKAAERLHKDKEKPT